MRNVVVIHVRRCPDSLCLFSYFSIVQCALWAKCAVLDCLVLVAHEIADKTDDVTAQGRQRGPRDGEVVRAP